VCVAVVNWISANKGAIVQRVERALELSDVDFGHVAAGCEGIRRSALKVRHTYIHGLQPHFTRIMLPALKHSQDIYYSAKNKLSDISTVNWLKSAGSKYLLASLGLNAILPTWSSVSMHSAVASIYCPKRHARSREIYYRRMHLRVVVPEFPTQEHRHVANEETRS
jgi:hypothetical protein